MGVKRHHALLRFVLAVLAVVVAEAVLRIPAVGQGVGTPILIFFFAILVSAWFGGLGPGLLATALIVVLTLPPSFPPWRIIRLALFLGCGVTTSVLFEALRAARWRAEAAAAGLRLSEGRLRQLIESITDHAIFTTGPDDQVASWSPGAERVLGYSEPEAINRHPSLFLEREDVLRVFPSGSPGGGCAETELRCVRKDGTRFLASASVSPLYRDGSPGTTWVLRDVTERNRAEAELRKAKESAESASQAKDQFLAALSHELRTPLTPALVSVTALMEDPDTPVSLRPGLEIIRRNIGLEARLIDDLLDVTRISRGKLRLGLEVADAHDLIRRAVEICRDEIATGGIELEVGLDAANHHVEADPARLQQILWNLLKNAVKFTPRRGRITIRSTNEGPSSSLSPPGRRLVVEVGDTGVGIDPAVLPRIFHAFEQGHRDDVQQFGGLGLGLAISRSLAEAHGGLLTATSPGKGRGATFTLELPVADAKPEPKPPETGREVAAGVAKPHILLVEDNQDTLRVLTRLLRSRGYGVTAADSVAAALEAAREPFDLLVSDIGLPDGSGLDLMTQVRARSAVPGIALSGFGMEEDLRKSREAGFATHLIKPVDFPTLEEAIQQAIAPRFA